MIIWDAFPTDRLIVEVSLWSADFTRFGEEIARMDPYADMYHIDVSDGHFVPGLLFFADLVAALRPLTKKPFHVHLMTDNPLLHIDDFLQAGADILTVQAENGPLAPVALQKIRERGASAGVAVGLDVSPERILPYLEMVDLILMMNTPLGVKGVEPSRLAYARIKQIREILVASGYHNDVKIAADGGIRQHSVPELRDNGADIIVAGSLVFKSQELPHTIAWLHALPGPKGP